MSRPAIEFRIDDTELLLLYSPRDEDEWVHRRLSSGDELILKGTFHLREAHLRPIDALQDAENDLDYKPIEFTIARRRGDYFEFDADILPVGCPILIQWDAPMTWKWFSAERRVSILGVIAQLRPSRIIIGGTEEDAIPVTEYERLVARFPTEYELKRYVLARVGAVVRQYTDADVDAEQLYRKYVARRAQQTAALIPNQIREFEVQKYTYLLERLKQMLAEEDSYVESVWQDQILQIILLLNPKYIKAIKSVAIRDVDGERNRQLDIVLIDASGNLDLIEIKQPFDKCVVTENVYRDNHIPLRELSGSIMQLEKYIYFLNRWGRAGEIALTERYKDQLPEGLKLKITNPSGTVILGRDRGLSEAQRRDFEVVRRKYKNILDIVTYDALVRRLEVTLDQLANA